MKSKFLFWGIILFSINLFVSLKAQHSVARIWNETLLQAIRQDFARPTVHARNLFHTSVLMYDAWAVYEDVADTYFLGKTLNGYNCLFDSIKVSTNVEEARKETISYGVYRLLKHRFKNSPGYQESIAIFNNVMTDLGYDTNFTSVDYSDGNPAALGNYLAENIINYGLIDGANEQEDYANQYYYSVNPSLIPTDPGSQLIMDPNRWQPLTFELFIDQSGNEIPVHTPDFLSPEWGEVYPFALDKNDLNIYNRDSYNYWVYHDPGAPPYLETASISDQFSDEYKWGFSLVSIWSSHLDPSDNVMWDISPGSIGNIMNLPDTFEDYHNFYNLLDGGDPSKGHNINPVTNQPYQPQIVPRGDYTRVLAEFWADGPDSETPPGHWFTILNYVNDHPNLEKRFNGKGNILDDLEWDVKAYFIMAGAVHDAAIAAWGIKGWYDYIRPISAIRYMADEGQSSDVENLNYSPSGIPLREGLIEIVQEGDPLAVEDSSNVGKVKLYTWRGPKYIESPESNIAGVGWILAENWWPYQRPTFITPPFAGYISGHSTFSRAAAEVMTLITGDEFFPGGIGEFKAPKNEFLQFEEGPSMDVVLQWATYRDASDQCSLSRIWGGIHPPSDDIPGRKIGEKIGINAFHHGEKYFNKLTNINNAEYSSLDNFKLFQNFPNPFNSQTTFEYFLPKSANVKLTIYDVLGREIIILTEGISPSGRIHVFWDGLDKKGQEVTSGLYVYSISAKSLSGIHQFSDTKKLLLIK